MAEDLSFPFRLYPTNSYFSVAESPYINSKYIPEVIRLYEFIHQINSSQQDSNILNVFVIGSIIDDNPSVDMFEPPHYFWQHCPSFIYKYLVGNKRANLTKPVRVIVISPSLSKNHPIFIEKTNFIYKWKQPDPSVLYYNSESYPDLSYNFFCANT